MEEEMEVETSRAMPRTSEYYAAEALATDMDIPVAYIIGETDKSIDDWLQENKPSQLSRNDGIGWIWVRKDANIDEEDDEDDDDDNDDDDNDRDDKDGCVGGEGDDSDDEDYFDEDVIKLQESWELLQSSGRQISVQSISDLAKMHNKTHGKWLFHVETGFKADHLWGIVARAIVKEEIIAKSAKISPFEPESDTYKHVCCVYNDNFLDYEQVLHLESGLRKIGIKCPLMYKPDVYTYLGIYRNNPWGLRPTLYCSNYNILTGTSVIKQNF